MILRPLFATLVLTAAAAATAPPLVSPDLDPTLAATVETVLAGAPRLEVRAAGADTRLSWSPGELLRLEQPDGGSRFRCADAAEFEAAERLLLPRAGTWLEVPPAGEVTLVVEELRLRPVSGVRLMLGREEGALARGEAAGRTLLDAAGGGAAARAAADGFDAPALLGAPVIMRDLRLVPVTLNPVIVRDGAVQAVESLTLRLVYGPAAAACGTRAGSDDRPPVSGNELRGAPRPWSGNMERVYAGLVPNHGQFYDLVDDSVFPVYLVTGSPNYLRVPNPAMDAFIKWKREKGFDVRVVPFDEIPGGGASIAFGDLRDWMRQQWQVLRPEFLLLVGDVDGVAACPDSVVQAHTGDYDVSDHFYAMQEGDDYFPELFVGRFSVDNAQQLYVMAEKPVLHEKNPVITGGDWLTRGLAVSCNYSDTGTPPISPNQTSRWVIDKLRANGFNLGPADSLFYPPLTDGGSLINAAINQGRGIVNYRGWANSNGWIYPAYDRDDLEALTNVMRMPFMGSFVCQTGAFGQGSGDVVVEDPCFGEKATRLGSPGAPRGFVAFVGPSDLHTRTQYNNPVCSGFYTGLFDLGLTSVGPALLNGKMELYTGYPLERDDPYSSYFYFHIYNVLGDADLKIWRHVPTTLVLDGPATLTPGQDVLEVQVRNGLGTPVDGVTVTLTAGVDGSQLLARGVTRNGHLLLDVDPDLMTAGLAAVLTADHVDFMPAQRNLGVAAVAEALALEGLEVAEETVDGQYRAGEALELRLQLRNTGGGAVAAGTATLRDPAQWEILPDWFTIETGSVATPALAPGAGATTDAAFRIRLAADAPDQGTLHLVADLEAGGFTGLTDGRLTLSNLALSLAAARWRSGAAQLLTGVLDTLDLDLVNSGAFDLAGAALTLASADPRVDVVEGAAALPALAREAGSTVSFVLQGGAGLFSGQAVHLALRAEAEGRAATLAVPLPVGGILPEDPLGPDAYGYYAIESGDYDVRIHPTHEWIELDPAYGGSGATRLLLADDEVTAIDLPFPVTHYGRTGSRLSICSNGWVSLGDTWIDDFRNWNLPSSLGPPNLICAYWDDLKPHYPDSAYVPVLWRHDAAEGRLVVAWSRTYNRYAWENPGQPLQEFQIILYDQAVRPTPTGDTEVLVQWKQVTDLDQNNNFATCGMENFGHDIGIQVSYANQPSPGCLGFGAGRSVLFTTRQPLHDSSYRVRVLEPQPQQWLTSTQPVLRWDHAAFTQVLQRDDVAYTVAVSTEEDLLFTREVDAAGVLDLEAEGLSLPEQAALFLDLGARVDDTDYPALQGRVPFRVDATVPSLTTALLGSTLYPGHLELGVLASEALAELSAVVRDGQGAVVAELAQDPGLTLLETGQELRYLRAQLAEGASVLALTARDLHGLESGVELPLAAVPFLAGRLELPAADGLTMTWQGGAGWAVALGRRDAADPRLLGMGGGLRAVELRLPEGADRADLALDAPAGTELVRRTAAGWRALPQERRGGQLVADLDGGALVGLIPAGAAAPALPAAFVLEGAFPNPFNPETWLRFVLPEAGEARLAVYNLTGERVRVLASGLLTAGAHRLRWDGCNEEGRPAASGVYLARLEWKGQARAARMLLLR